MPAALLAKLRQVSYLRYRMTQDTNKRDTNKAGPQKHLPFFKLIDACSQQGCPLCTLLRADEAQYFESLLYERVNDRQLRARFNASGGFCGYHADYLCELRDGLAVVLLYRQVLRNELDRAPHTTQELCPACAYLREREQHWIRVLGRFVHDGELQTAFTRSDGLCLPHYRRMQNECHRLPQWFAKYNATQFERLYEAVNSYIDASNFTSQSKQEEGKKPDETVYTQLIAKLYGFRGVPGSPRPGASSTKRERGSGNGGAVKKTLGKVLRRLLFGEHR